MITVDPNKICYVFDVDGTLTEPRQRMNSDFANEFILWSLTKQCYIATGSDYKKTQDQVPWDVLDCFKNIFCCMGNEVRGELGQAIHKSEFVLPKDLDYDLQQFLKNSKFNLKTGNHIEFRTGMVNFSIVGRNADYEQRSFYNLWDRESGERQMIADYINKNYPTLNASVGGSISIDIIEEGQDKGQVIQHLENAGATKVVFVGDRCFPGGNDHGIIRELEKSDLAFEWYNVNGPDETRALIRTNRVFDGGK
tara:strand:- start:118 stop:873 length:756 start_codon:yes stop_codon:yes gene_type:complete